MNEKKSIFSMRNIFKMLSLVCIVITFCPTFLVSCSGQKLDVSAMDLVTGISVYGEKSDPYPAHSRDVHPGSRASDAENGRQNGGEDPGLIPADRWCYGKGVPPVQK